MTILRTRRWILIAPVGLILVLGLVLFIIPGPGTTYAKPTLDVMHIDTIITGTCAAEAALKWEADLEWTGSQFAKRDGFRRISLYKEETLVASSPFIRIPAGTSGESQILFVWRWQSDPDPTGNYSFEVSFYRGQGKNGVGSAKPGKLLMTHLGGPATCGS